MGCVKRTFTWRTFLTVPCGEKDSTLGACWPEAAETRKNKKQRLNHKSFFMIASCEKPNPDEPEIRISKSQNLVPLLSAIQLLSY